MHMRVCRFEVTITALDHVENQELDIPGSRVRAVVRSASLPHRNIENL